MSEIRYPYKPRLGIAISCFLLFGIFAYFMGQIALEDADDSTLLYWAITLLFTALSALGILLLFKSLTSKNELILTEHYLQAPKSGISNALVKIPFKNITDIAIRKAHSNTFLTIFHKHGELTLVSSVLPKKDDFSDVMNHIASRTQC